MISKQYHEIFRKSNSIGILYELISYCCVLICGYLVSNLLESVIANQWQRMYKTAVLAIIALVISSVVKYVIAVCRFKYKLKDTQVFRLFLYHNVIDRSISIDDPGEMNIRMTNDVKTLSTYFQETQPKSISGLLVMTCSTILLCKINFWIGLIFFLINFTQLIPIFFYENLARQIYNKTNSDEEKYSNWMLEGYNGIRTIKAYGMESWYMNHYYQLNRAIVNSGKQAEQVGTIENIIFKSIDSLLNYGCYVIIGLFILLGKLNLQQAPLLIILAGYLFSSISSIYDLRLQRIDSEEAYTRLTCCELSESHVDSESILSVKNITKSYGEKIILQNVSLTINAGDRILIKGTNGSGKSTLLRIMVGLEKADVGNVTLGLPKRLCTVSLQEEPDLNISGAELIEAMQYSHCIDSEMLMRHITNFQIPKCICKSLSDMSPGERKKFFLSVALAHQGKLLILDEPTNHLDKSSIRYLLDKLASYKGTLIVCTHAAEIDLGWSRIICIDGGSCYESE